MAVPKTTQTRYMDGSVQATQMTTQVTPFLHLFFLIEHVSKLCCQSTGNSFGQITKMKNDVDLHLVCVVFGTAIPTSLYIFTKCFSYLFVYYFLYNSTQNVLASFIQNSTNISVIRATIATSQRRRYEWALKPVISHLRSWEAEPL